MVNFTSGLGFALASRWPPAQRQQPAGRALAAPFMGAMTSGSTQLEMLGGVPRSMASILMGIIIMPSPSQSLRPRLVPAADGGGPRMGGPYAVSHRP